MIAMGQRRYTIHELDRMRLALSSLVRTGSCTDEARVRITEEHLRTHMLNGTAPEDLEAEAARVEEEREKQRKDRLRFGPRVTYSSADRRIVTVEAPPEGGWPD